VKEITLTHDSDKFLPVPVQDGQMANPPQVHDVISKRQLFVAPQSGDIGCH
jgi:hypothetical protein